MDSLTMTLSNGWISISVRRVSGPAGKMRLPRMLPELTIAMSAARLGAHRVGDHIAEVGFRGAQVAG